MSRERLGEALRQLYARVPLGMRLGLTPMKDACARAGNPERSFEAVHIGGTNGKGSVCAMVESIARATGQKTGLFTSPHLSRFAERIRINGEPVSDDALVECLEEALSIGADLSFFETATLAAFLAFRSAKVDLAVLEVGIGGRLDATNVIETAKATAITKVALDHQDKLGNTLVEIAREKAAIGKSGVPMVIGTVPEDVRFEIERVCRSLKGKPEFIDDERIPKIKVASPLPGLYQTANVRVAARIGVHLGADEAAITRGLSNAKWPGRFEWVEHATGPVLLDAAHNPDGMLAFVASLSAIKSRVASAPMVLVFGALADKEWAEMIDIAASHFEHRVYTVPKGRAAVRPDAINERHQGIVDEDPKSAYRTARAIAGEKGLVVVAGSIFLVGEIRGELLEIPSDPVVAL